MLRNYYTILGVAVDSSQQEIEAAYRKLSQKFRSYVCEHGHDPLGAVQEAYSILNRQELRKVYDSSLQAEGTIPTHRISLYGEKRSSRQPLTFLVPMHNQITVNQNALTSFEDRLQSRSENSWCLQGLNFETLSMEVSLTPAQARQGGQIQLAIPVLIRCPNCKGLGDRGFFPCRPCHGTGIVNSKRSIPVNYPADLQDNSSVHLSLSDNDICNLLLVVHFKISRN